MNSFKQIIGGFTALLLIAVACSNRSSTKDPILDNETAAIETTTIKAFATPHYPSEAFKEYWYAGEAEISSYRLEQARYGELRSGNAVLIYVTEDFLPNIQVKADQSDTKNIPVLKLNSTKKFNTGIYPYSFMQSVFYPVADDNHALKVSSSMQEWCGHMYAQLNNKERFEITSHSYFQGEADQSFHVEKTLLENELWTKIRIRPEELPVGTLQLIPSLAFCGMKHIEIKAYTATASLAPGTVSSSYELSYPELNRNLKITFNTEFPYTILGWEETFGGGSGSNAKQLTTTARLKKRIKSPYWNKNRMIHEPLRDSLGLQRF